MEKTKCSVAFCFIMTLIIVFGLVLSGPIGVFAQLSNNDGTTQPEDSGWRLLFDGAVSNPLNLSVSDFEAMPQTTVSGDLYCYGILISSGNWKGVQLDFLLEEAAVDPSATALEFHASDGYKISVSILSARQNDLIIANKLNDAPIDEFYRLVVPGANGANWISMITEVTVTMSTVYNFTSDSGSPIVVTAPPQTPSPTPPSPPLTATPTNTASPPPTNLPSDAPQPTPSTPPTSIPTHAPTSQVPQNATQPENVTSLSGQQGQPQSPSGHSLPVLPILSAVFVTLTIVSLAVFWRRRSLRH